MAPIVPAPGPAGHNGTVSEPSEEDRARIAARYPATSTMDRVLGVGAGLALVLAVVLVVIAGLERSNPPVVGMVRAFDVVGPDVTRVELVVQRSDPAQAATCALFAQATNYELVGETEVEVPAGDEVLEVVTVDLRTLREATSVTLENCRLSG